MVRKLKRRNLFVTPNLEKVADKEYLIVFPESADKFIQKHYEAVENLENDYPVVAEKGLNDVIKSLKGHFASYNLLIDIAQGNNDHSKVAKLFTNGEREAKTILNAVSKEDSIPWKYGSNRDFLRFLYNLGVRALATSSLKKAEEIFKTIIRLNPSDDQDVKEILVDTLFDLKKYDEIIEISKDYDHSKNSAMIFNEILCQYIKGDLERAAELTGSLNEESISVFRNLLDGEGNILDDSSAHNYIPISVIQNKSLFYWENFKEYWDSYPGSIDFLKENITLGEAPTATSAVEKEGVADLDTCPLDAFKGHLEEKKLKETTVREHIDNIKLFEGVLSSKEGVLEEVLNIYKGGVTKSKLNKLVTTLNQYFRFVIEDKEALKEILGDLKTLKEGLLNSM
ncbi:hypothetical protein PM10SUCC1_12560 [Propionigenium maris DSM 9537]|uniref:Uncharacterized protein n=1 Tax=Propionigenium maris DSM 9537 TaxID=1123000 RepID=A0A9W6LMK8_9FUSO|nr:hypothetical protein [Propionigenium maris]GLI55742.1 hypothetical protein PM10SUCC1_12560 [Propionigenium maris DSM 9537]